MTWTSRTVIAPEKSPLRPLVSGWLDEVERYGEWWQWEDVCWNHGERAAVSTLVAAVTRLDGVCIQEYKARKQKDKSDCKGLCDASLSYEFDGKRINFDAEAKQITVPIRDSSIAQDQLETALLDAEGCVKQLAVTGKRLAVLFVTFTAYPKEEQKRLHDYFPGAEKTLRKVLKKWPRSAAALYLTDRKPIRYIPGTALLIKEIR